MNGIKSDLRKRKRTKKKKNIYRVYINLLIIYIFNILSINKYSYLLIDNNIYILILGYRERFLLDKLIIYL